LQVGSWKSGVAVAEEWSEIPLGVGGWGQRRKVNFVMPEIPLPHGQSIDPLVGRAVARTRT
jgi:hypothetical protein